MVLAKYARPQKAMWRGNPEAKHAFTFVQNAGKAVFLLVQHPEIGNQIWHLSTATALSGHEFIRLAAEVFNTPPKFLKVNKLILQLLGLFTKAIGETAELYYQYQFNYIFNSEKFEKTFGVKPTPYPLGIRQLSHTIFEF